MHESRCRLWTGRELREACCCCGSARDSDGGAGGWMGLRSVAETNLDSLLVCLLVGSQVLDLATARLALPPLRFK
jgi:hypothetical protein